MPVIVSLRPEQSFLELPQIKRLSEETQTGNVVALKVREVENAVELMVSLIDVCQRIFLGRVVGFADGERVIVRERVLVQFFQKFMDPGAVDEIDLAALEGFPAQVVPDRIDLGEHVEDVEAEAVHAFLKPEIQDVIDLAPDLGFFPVQVRLLLAEEVQIILVRPADPFPGRSGERRSPVRRRSHFPLHEPAFPDDVVITVLGTRIRDRGFEPGMLGRSVVEDHVHDDLEIPPVAFRKQPVEIRHGTEFPVNVPVIADIIAVVVVRRLVERREPDRRHAKFFDIVQLREDAFDIPKAVVVRVHKGKRIDLIDYRILIPLRSHKLSLLPGFPAFSIADFTGILKHPLS